MQVLEIAVDEDEEECVDLISSSRHATSNKESRSSIGGKYSSVRIPPVRLTRFYHQHHCWKVRLGFALAICVVGVFYALSFQSSSNEKNTSRTDEGNQQVFRFECPAQQATAENVETAIKEHEEWYVTVSQRIASSNLNDYFETFRFTEYDNWGHSYDEVKQGMYKWKSQQFASLKNGDLIYESACGIGLNLYMTLEILNEKHGLSDLVVYGNEYVPLSVEIAQKIAGGTVNHPGSFLPARGQLGSICQADSTQLEFVPANRFDLVYTGYISPLFNPLGLNGTSTSEKFEQYIAYCAGETEQHVELSERAQRRQEDWYASWVSAMIRIAKPGAPVIVEQVSYPLCDALFDWGGVPQSFWSDAIRSNGWDIDPSSLVFDTDSIFRRRYHVSMRKNP